MSLDLSQIAVIGAALSATVIVPLTSFVKKERWPNPVKFLIAVVLSAVMGVLQVVSQHTVNSWHDFFMLWGLNVAATQTAYHLYFGGSELDTVLTSIFGGKQTTPTKVVPPPNA